MERVLRNRRVTRKLFEETLERVKRMVSEQQSLNSIRMEVFALQQSVDMLNIMDKEIYEKMSKRDNTDEDELKNEVDEAQLFQKKFYGITLEVDGFAAMNSQRSADSGESMSASSRRNFKLPPIQLKMFDGAVKDWLPFWAQFTKIHEDESIDKADKIEYVRMATVPNSRARRIVESFPSIDVNYDKIINALKSRFGRDEIQIEVYVRELLKMILNNAMAKNKTDVACLYDQLETHMRALESLGVTSSKCGAMLYPLIESCLPEELLRAWQRSHIASRLVGDGTSGQNQDQDPLSHRLTYLMEFLRSEAEGEQKISLAQESFGFPKETRNRTDENSKGDERIPSAACLVNQQAEKTPKCLFCDKNHDSVSCFTAQKWSLQQKHQAVNDKRACFKCLRRGHQAKTCRSYVSCLVCQKPHVTFVCPQLPIHQVDTGKNDQNNEFSNTLTSSNITQSHVFLQTLKIRLIGKNRNKMVRALIDTGSQNSYILQTTADYLGYTSKKQQQIRHTLFGGSTVLNNHNEFDVLAKQGFSEFKFEALSQHKICNDIVPVFRGPWSEELHRLGIQASDQGNSAPIELLFGSDLAGKLYTGNRMILDCGLVAVETIFGWTLMGRIPLAQHNNACTTAVSLLLNDASLEQLWQLDVLGITESADKKSSETEIMEARELFNTTTEVNAEGRYEVRLPWRQDHSPLPDNYVVAQKRLQNTVKKLEKEGLLEEYSLVFKEWMQEGVIEIVESDKPEGATHYLPHRPVVKMSSATTKIRPVFDASARLGNNPSLNNCLQKGANLIEAIPNLLVGFRSYGIGVVSDIRKAFLQISIKECDRDVLRFLWINAAGKEIVFRHRRVVFGLICSPFLLGATLERHMQFAENDSVPCISIENLKRLASSFYVDNCVTSVSNQETLKSFIEEASMLMSTGRFDLRGWEYTRQTCEVSEPVPVLGLSWEKEDDTLSLSTELLRNIETRNFASVTKRSMLSCAHKVFDPIGFTCPATLRPKLLLQRAWGERGTWDAPVSNKIAEEFRQWLEEVHLLAEIKIPRWIGLIAEDTSQITLHTFCDASQDAYAAVVFLRGVRDEQVFVHLMAAKSRIAPPKKLTIPRLELLAALIGARLCRSVIAGLKRNVISYFWCDSTTVLSWIQREEQWSAFVSNRVKEIRFLSPCENWNHISGASNPADLPSRGCSPKILLQSKWWRGPEWMRASVDEWPVVKEESGDLPVNEERIVESVTCVARASNNTEDWHLQYFGKFERTVRMIAWVRRFVNNTKKGTEKRKGAISSEETSVAEIFLLKLVQEEAFAGDEAARFRTLVTFTDSQGLLRVKTRILKREDADLFRYPIILPGKHPVVSSLVFDAHTKACHIRAQSLLCMLRERYWVLGGRRAIATIIKTCSVCLRHQSKPVETEEAALPADRVREAAAFEITGVDFAGPIFLREKVKAWVCVFTCAVYRAVHLELCTSLLATDFVKALRRFIARRGRPVTIYSDNGKNFVGTANALSTIDWDAVLLQTSTDRIKWCFSPPSAPWWGGFWERMVGVLKMLLRKTLRRSLLTYEDLTTVLCDCEATINSRPLTYQSGDPEELAALTPVMFLREYVKEGVADCDSVDRGSLTRKVKHLQRLREQLRARFRIEYLGQLSLLRNKKGSPPLRVGEVVLVSSDHEHRVVWPLGRVIEVFRASDGQVRVVRVSTAKGLLLRPVKRLYRLECSDDKLLTNEEEVTNDSIQQL